MDTTYQNFLRKLENIPSHGHPFISMYVPLRWTEVNPYKIFNALVKAADNILLKDGHARLAISPPQWEKWYLNKTTTLAIFTNGVTTEILSLPINMSPRVVVAKSFHVKPILASINECVHSLLLHFSEKGVSLFKVDSSTENLIDRYLPPGDIKSRDWPHSLDRKSMRQFLEFLFKEINHFISPGTKFVAITGQSFYELRSESFWKRLPLEVIFLNESFLNPYPSQAFALLRFKLSQVINDKYQSAVSKALKNNDDLKITFEELGKKILTRRINYLCISLDDMIFGEFDLDSGNISLNKIQKNTKDDDILDDLLELSIKNGIKVSVVPKKYLPEGLSFVYA